MIPPDYIATDEDLPKIFFGGEAPPKPAPDWDRIATVAAMLHWPMWSLSELEKQRLREERQREKGFSPAKFEAENGKPKGYIKRKKANQMRLWIAALAKLTQDEKRRLTPFERTFCRTLWLKFRRYGENTKWLTQNQYEKLREIAAKHLAAKLLSTPGESSDTSKAISLPPAINGTISNLPISAPCSQEKECESSQIPDNLKKEGWKIA